MQYNENGCRWLRACVDERKLVAQPKVTKEWLDTKDENTMYSPTLLELGVTPWKAPWMKILCILYHCLSMGSHHGRHFLAHGGWTTP